MNITEFFSKKFGSANFLIEEKSSNKMWQMLIIILTNIQIIYSTAIESDYFENEFLLGDERKNDRNAMKSPANKWPLGIVPYRFGDEYIERDKAAVLHAMEVFREKTCIKFVLKRDHHSEYIVFKKSKSGCGTLVGYKTEPVDVSLSEKCLKLTGAIQHEILHVLGLWHEQSRPDRDEFVDILWDNIQSGHLVIFIFRILCDLLQILFGTGRLN